MFCSLFLWVLYSSLSSMLERQEISAMLQYSILARVMVVYSLGLWLGGDVQTYFCMIKSDEIGWFQVYMARCSIDCGGTYTDNLSYTASSPEDLQPMLNIHWQHALRWSCCLKQQIVGSKLCSALTHLLTHLGLSLTLLTVDTHEYIFFAERVRNKSTGKNPGCSWDSTPRPSETSQMLLPLGPLGPLAESGRQDI